MLFLTMIFPILILCTASSKDALSFDLINAVNSNPESTWIAGINSIFVGKSLEEAKQMLGSVRRDSQSPPFPEFRPTHPLPTHFPESFDVYENWPKCAYPIRNQGQCGSCWAFSLTETMSDRFCIAGKGVILSPQDLVSCESDEYACQGGYLSREWEYLEKTGIVSDACFPYVSGSGIVPKCPLECVDKTIPWKPYKSQYNSTVHYRTAADAMTGLMTDGSIQTTMDIYQDFFDYKSGVYYHQYGGLAGNHAIKIQGWGVSKGMPYWKIANSWGDQWGLNGYFWIKRGNDECGIEDTMYAALPLV